MADKITNDHELIIGLTNSVEKLKKITLKNPKNDLTESEVKTAITNLIEQVGIIDDAGEYFSSSSITTAYTEKTKKTVLDI